MKYALLKLRNRQEEAQPVTEVNIIPVIDISLVLLVILFVTAPMLSVPNMPVEMPHSSAPESHDPTIAVTYAKDGQMSVVSAPVDWESLLSTLRAEVRKRPEASVILRVDKSVPYRQVQKLIAAAKAAGALRIALGTEPYQ